MKHLFQVKNIYVLPAHHQKFLSPDSLGKLAILEPHEEVQFTTNVSPACVYPYSYPASLETFTDVGYVSLINYSKNANN